MFQGPAADPFPFLLPVSCSDWERGQGRWGSVSLDYFSPFCLVGFVFLPPAITVFFVGQSRGTLAKIL